MNSPAFDDFCTILGSPTSETVEIAKGIRVNNATATYANYINTVSQQMVFYAVPPIHIADHLV